MKRLGKAIAKYEALRKEELTPAEHGLLDDYIDKLEMLEKLSHKPLTRENIMKVMSVTCYGSVAFCCGLENRCMWRNFALAVLGLSKKDYLRLKEQFTEMIIQEVKEKGGD